MKKLFSVLALMAMLSGSAATLAANEDKSKSSNDLQKTTGEVATPTKSEAKNDIGAYRRDMLTRIAKHWKPTNKQATLTVTIKLSPQGKLLQTDINQSSGSKEFDQSALDSIKTTEFAPLPDWYKGEGIQFKVDLAKVDKAK